MVIVTFNKSVLRQNKGRRYTFSVGCLKKDLIMEFEVLKPTKRKSTSPKFVKHTINHKSGAITKTCGLYWRHYGVNVVLYTK